MEAAFVSFPRGSPTRLEKIRESSWCQFGKTTASHQLRRGGRWPYAALPESDGGAKTTEVWQVKQGAIPVGLVEGPRSPGPGPSFLYGEAPRKRLLALLASSG